MNFEDIAIKPIIEEDEKSEDGPISSRRDFLKKAPYTVAGIDAVIQTGAKALATSATAMFLAACESPEERLKRIIQDIKNSNPTIRIKAIREFSAMNLKEMNSLDILPAIPALLEAVKDQNQVVQSYASETLQKLVLTVGVNEDIAQGVPSLIEIAGDSNPPSLFRGNVIRLLEDIAKQVDYQEFAGLREDIIIAFVVTLFNDSHQSVAEQATETVRKLCAMYQGWYLIDFDEEAVSILKKLLLEHPNNIVRMNIAYILGKTNRIETFPELVKALKDSSLAVRQEASRSLLLLAQGFKVNFLWTTLPLDVMADLTDALNASKGIVYENLTEVLKILKRNPSVHRPLK